MVQKKPIKIWDADVIVISKLVETKINSKYLIGYLDKVIRLLIVILPEMSRYVNTTKIKDGDKDKSSNLVSYRIEDEALLGKYKTIWTKIEELKILN